MQVIENCDLTEFNAYKLRSRCTRAIFPGSEQDLVEIFKEKMNIPFILLGNGNNIILSKKQYNACFIIINGSFNSVDILDRKIITAEAGATLLQLSELALKNCLSGFEIFCDIPSSVGGAIVMNAGSGGIEIKDILIKVRYLDLVDMEIKERYKNELDFQYRNSFFLKNRDKVILRAWFSLKNGDPLFIRELMDSTRLTRWSKQPRDYPNCGSVFKRPDGFFVGTMIQELGLKGFTIGGASISEKHAGFIINKGFSTGEDIIKLVQLIQKRVFKKYNIRLELEQIII
jgi:UDP-N-acetylmuramate dehydrogenase